MAFVPETLSNSISVRLDQLVEDVVGSLHSLLLSDTRLFKQIGHNVASTELARGSEVDTDEFTKTGGVVIPGSLGISVGLQNGIGGHNLVFKRNLFLNLLGSTTSSDHGKIGDDLLGVLGLPGTRLASNQNGLILTLW